MYKIKTKNNSQSFRLVPFLLMICLCILLTRLIEFHQVSAEEIQKGIASEIIRFHVIANSDSKEDQALKLKVKDALVKELSSKLCNAQNIGEAREIVKHELNSLKDTAETVITENGYSYPISVSLGPCYFPLKVYGEYSFPPGTYEALRVEIGTSKGHNWWCVMFPPLCFVDETYSIVSDDSSKQLKKLLTEEEYNTLKGDKLPVKIRFKVFDSIKKLF